MSAIASELRDAQLVLTDLKTVLERRLGRRIAWRVASVARTYDEEVLDRLRLHLSATDTAGLEVPASVIVAILSRAPWIPIPTRWSVHGRHLVSGLLDLEVLSLKIHDALEAAGHDGWRSLEESTSRGRFASKTHRQSYRSNVAAG